MHKTLCNKCNKEVTNNNFAKHHNSCVGIKRKKIRGIDFDPNWGYATGCRVAWNKGQTESTDERVALNAIAVREAKKLLPPSGCFAWTTEQRSANAKARGFGGYRENSGHSKKFKVIDSFGKPTTLQSTYELECFHILTDLGINWNRPKALKYDNRNYFADFYLTDYDIYLDPKNSYKAKLDEEKINKVIEQNNVKVYVLLKEQITKEYITRLAQLV